MVKFFVVKKEQNLLLTKNQPTLEKCERKYIKIKLQRAKNCYSRFLLRHKINKLILIRSTCIRVYDKSQIILNSNYSGSYIGSSVFGTDDRNISLECFYVLLFSVPTYKLFSTEISGLRNIRPNLTRNNGSQSGLNLKFLLFLRFQNMLLSSKNFRYPEICNFSVPKFRDSEMHIIKTVTLHFLKRK